MELAKTLVWYGADVTLRNFQKETPIDVAESYGHRKLYYYLEVCSTVCAAHEVATKMRSELGFLFA